ncbi:hypothetical protein DB32_006377 [Sandaracinus amylolyticus]|uniref:Uncharacterized protein n=1 Tax=Sandaracinus amylolyticus TaxID=927083 RepID=A0A0F6YLI3_9BACT|nr:hypothetical protein DB32_006377 [Sandaracinus amylolyticus]
MAASCGVVLGPTRIPRGEGGGSERGRTAGICGVDGGRRWVGSSLTSSISLVAGSSGCDDGRRAGEGIGG